MIPTFDRSDFLAAEQAARAARRQAAADARRERDRAVAAAEAAFRAARGPACAADRLELEQAFDAVHELAELTDAFAVRSEGVLTRLAAADPALVAADPLYGRVLVETVGDRLADRDLARLYAARAARLEAAR